MSTKESRSDTGAVRVRALRGATTVSGDEPAAIVAATEDLLAEMLRRNEVDPGELISMIFTATSDLNSEFPAAAARRLGLADVPLLCAREIEVPDGTPRCIRILAHLYTARSAPELEHVYLEGARNLRADLVD
jgi:chorismate mutase